MRISLRISSFFYSVVLSVVLGNSLGFAQTVDEKIINWKPDQFSEVLFPSDFGVVENLIWGAKVLFNHPDFNEIVPVYAYNRADFCDSENKENTLPGALIFHLGFKTDTTESESEDYSKFGKAKWEESLATACDDLNLKIDSEGWIVQDDSTDELLAIFEKIASNYEIALTDNSESSDEYFILTIDEVPDIDPAVEFWWMCNDQTEQIPDTVCHEAFRFSPFSKHKQLVKRHPAP